MRIPFLFRVNGQLFSFELQIYDLGLSGRYDGCVTCDEVNGIDPIITTYIRDGRVYLDDMNMCLYFIEKPFKKYLLKLLCSNLNIKLRIA